MGKNSIYENQFLKSIRNARKFISSEEITENQVNALIDYIKKTNLRKDELADAKFFSIIRKLSHDFISNRDPINQLGRRCHTVSEDFNQFWHARSFNSLMGLYLTVGEVKYKNQSIYNVTEQIVRDCVVKGFQEKEALGVHVWLTLANMTILDLSLMASLLRMGLKTPEEYQRNPIILGKSHEIKDFLYEPILVDNRFAHRVDVLE